MKQLLFAVMVLITVSAAAQTKSHKYTQKQIQAATEKMLKETEEWSHAYFLNNPIPAYSKVEKIVDPTASMKEPEPNVHLTQAVGTRQMNISVQPIGNSRQVNVRY